MLKSIFRNDPKFGNWLIVGSFLTRKKEKKWIYQCECGLQRIVCYRNLFTGNATACYCGKIIPPKTRIEYVSSKNKDGCWEWPGPILKDGYCRFFYEGTAFLAHVASYEIFIGNVTRGYYVKHKCRNKICVNPHHLWIINKKLLKYMSKIKKKAIT